MSDTDHNPACANENSETATSQPGTNVLLASPHGPSSRYAVHAALGFVCGAAFWHLVGFWSFVSETVHTGPSAAVQRDDTLPIPKFDARKIESALSDRHQTQISTLQSSKQPPLTTGSISKGPRNCSTLALNRRSGRVETRPCGSWVLAQHRLQKSQRQDLIPTRSIHTARGRLIGWTTSVGQSTTDMGRQ